MGKLIKINIKDNKLKKLRYLNLRIDRYHEQYYSDNMRFAYNFASNCRFIANYLSKAIRKYKIENGFGITMLSIRLTPDDNSIKIDRCDAVLEIFLHFTKEDIAKLDILTKSEAEAIIKSNIEKKNQEDGEQKISNPEKRPINDIRNEFKEDIKSNTDDKSN